MCRRNELQDVPVRPVHVSSPQDEAQAPNPTFELAGGLSVRGRLWLIVIAVAVPLLLLLAGIVWWLTEHQRDAKSPNTRLCHTVDFQRDQFAARQVHRRCRGPGCVDLARNG